jgi:molybdopterin synthase sulfur carrier subunit
MKNITVQYFAILREQRGLAVENLLTDVVTPLELYAQLQGDHQFSLPADRIRIAINDNFADATSILREGDRVVFIPPVAGG